MALIKCEGCGSMVSDKASVCPKCGYSLVTLAKGCSKTKKNCLILLSVLAFSIISIVIWKMQDDKADMRGIGKTIEKCYYVNAFSDGLAKVQSDEIHGFINKKGALIISEKDKWNILEGFSEVIF